jgi:hypothetical protein
VRAEGLGVTAKSLTTFLVLMYDARAGTGGLALVAFALGQLMYSAVVFGTYIAYLGVGYMRPQLPSPPSSSPSSGYANVLSYIRPLLTHIYHLCVQEIPNPHRHLPRPHFPPALAHPHPPIPRKTLPHGRRQAHPIVVQPPARSGRIRYCCQLWCVVRLILQVPRSALQTISYPAPVIMQPC